MNLARERPLCIEVYKTYMNCPNPCFMQELFKLRGTNRNAHNKYELKLDIPVAIKLLTVLKALEVLDLKYGTLYHTT